MVKVVYPPSEKTLQRIEDIRRLREKGIPTKEIAKQMKRHSSWINALENWDKQHRIAQPQGEKK